MLNSLKQMDAAFQHVKWWTLFIVSACILGMITVSLISMHAIRTSKNEVYLISQDQVIKAFANPRDALVSVEAQSHIRQFHQLLFNLSPDENLIEKQLAEALYLGDQSVKIHLDNLRETGYFKQLLAANVSQHLLLDSISLDEERGDYPFRLYAKQEIVRSSAIVFRSLITQGFLRPIQRTPANPHGFLIEKWEIIENKDLYKKSR